MLSRLGEQRYASFWEGRAGEGEALSPSLRVGAGPLADPKTLRLQLSSPCPPILQGGC